MNTIPDVDTNKSSISSNEHSNEWVTLSESDCKQSSLIKQRRKQMTILDYCKSTKLNESNKIAPQNGEINSTMESSLVPVVKSSEMEPQNAEIISTMESSLVPEVKSSEIGSDRDSPISISSVDTIKTRKRNRARLESTSPVEVLKKRQKNHRNSIHDKRKSVSKPTRLSLSKQSKEKKSSTNDVGEENVTYAVEKVVGIAEIENVAHFHIKWKGYPASQNTWEPLSNLTNCIDLLTKYLINEVETHETTIDAILVDMNSENKNVLTEEAAFQQLKDFDAIFVLTHLVLLASLNGDSDVKTYEVICNKLREKNNSNLLSYWTRRNEQLKDLEQWQSEINKSDKSSQITVENNVDFEKSPSTFKYINDCEAGEGVVIPNDPVIGCDCKNGCSLKSNCCGKQLGSEYAYSSCRAIRLPQGHAVFECNKLCKCGPDCTNRVVQQGRKHSLTIFKTSNDRGWGVRTDRVIAKGQYICEYVGEIITNKEAEARGHIYDAEKRTYLFDLDCNSIVENKENLYTIDACKMGNVSRMINHSCDPNIGTWSVWIDCLDLDIPKICFYALRRIEAGEELSFDYLNFSVHDVHNKTEDDQSLLNIKTNFECRCNSEKCRKYIFDPSLLNVK